MVEFKCRLDKRKSSIELKGGSHGEDRGREKGTDEGSLPNFGKLV